MIQIDMQMPDACDVCPFNYDFCWCKAFGNYDEWEKYSDDWNDHVCDRETRPEYCPLKEQPEIVRCRDCKHGSIYMTEDVCGKTLIECNHPELGDTIAIHEWDWFCADGERR